MTLSDASRINGRKSRGPVTAEGKQRSSRNAVTHGLTAACDKAFLCQNEDQQGWDSLYEDLIRRLRPEGQVELDLVAELAHARWRLRRCCVIETGVLDAEMHRQAPDLHKRYETVDDGARLALAFSHLAEHNRTLDVLSRYESHARRAFDRTLRNLLQIQSARKATVEHFENLRNEPNGCGDSDTRGIIPPDPNRPDLPADSRTSCTPSGTRD